MTRYLVNKVKIRYDTEKSECGAYDLPVIRVCLNGMDLEHVKRVDFQPEDARKSGACVTISLDAAELTVLGVDTGK